MNVLAIVTIIFSGFLILLFAERLYSKISVDDKLILKESLKGFEYIWIGMTCCILILPQLLNNSMAFIVTFMLLYITIFAYALYKVKQNGLSLASFKTLLKFVVCVIIVISIQFILFLI
jgi:hypothetical protein